MRNGDVHTTMHDSGEFSDPRIALGTQHKYLNNLFTRSTSIQSYGDVVVGNLDARQLQQLKEKRRSSSPQVA
jgi:hypothetical protein